MFRADLHVHSRHSGRGHLRLPGAPPGLPDPEAIVRAGRERGLDLITITDLDTIDGCLEFLERRGPAPDFMISEEASALDPRSGARLSVLLYDITEAQHREAQRLRGDARDLLAFARRAGLIASLGPLLVDPHPGRVAEEALREIFALVDRYEVKNGARGRSHDLLVAQRAHHAAPDRAFGVTAGSGAHVLSRVGRALTVSAARSRREFLEDLRGNRTWAAGEDGSLRSSVAEACAIVGRGYAAALGVVAAKSAARDRPRPSRASLLALPLHLAGWPVWGTCLERARATRRARRARRGLDRMEVLAFKEKALSYRPLSLAAEAETGDAG